MPSDGEGLLWGILEEPESDARRLVYADWLEEHDQEARGAFVRAQVELARWPCECDEVERVYHPECRCQEKGELQRRVRDLLHLEWSDAIAGTLGLNCFVRKQGTTVDSGAHPHLFSWTFCRGFVEEITLPLTAFRRHAQALFQAAPIRQVRLVGADPRCDPYPFIGADRQVHWWIMSGAGNRNRPEAVSRRLLHLLRKHTQSALWTGTGAGYRSREAALAALSDVLVLWGRQRAGLAPLAQVGQ